MIGLQDGLVEYRTHFRWAVILIAVVFLALCARLFFLQIVNGERYETLATVSHVVRERIVPPRGSIYDRNGVLMASDVEVSDLMVIPHHVSDPEAVVKRLIDLGVMNASEAADALEKIIDGRQGTRRFHKIPIKRNLVGIRCPHDLEPLRFDSSNGRMVCSKCGKTFFDEKAVVQAHLHEMPGFSLHSRMVRYYPAGAVAVHALGYVNEVNAEEVESSGGSMKATDIIGRSGIEKAMDSVLRGVAGEDVYVRSASGNRIRPSDLPEPFKDLESFPPRAGKNIRLTLDIVLQKAAVAALKPQKSGAVVVMDVQTGEVLVMASEPTFELGPRLTATASEPVSPLASEFAPMMNKAVSAFPPGSTFKVFTTLAGLMEGVIDARTRVDCPGYYEYRNRRFRCFQRFGHGEVDVVSSLAESCDTYFYRLGDLLGMDVIAHYGRDLFGVGEKTGIEIGEMSGLMPTERWYTTSRGGFQPGFAINASVGQGDIRATPLSMARAYSALVNGGRLMRPYLVQALIDIETGEETAVRPEVTRTLPLKPEHLDLVMKGLFGAVNDEDGTAYTSRIVELPFSGKTGTAEARESRKDASPEIQSWLREDHAWFLALAPARRPRIAVAVFVEHAGFGGAVAAPIARKVIETYYREHADEFGDLWEGFKDNPELEIIWDNRNSGQGSASAGEPGGPQPVPGDSAGTLPGGVDAAGVDMPTEEDR